MGAKIASARNTFGMGSDLPFLTDHSCGTVLDSHKVHQFVNGSIQFLEV